MQGGRGDLGRYVAGSFGVNSLLDRLLLFESCFFLLEGRGGMDRWVYAVQECLFVRV